MYNMYSMYNILGKTHIKNRFFFSGRTTKRGCGGGKNPLNLRKKLFFCDWEKWPEPNETQEKLTKQMCLLCSVLVNIDEPKNVMNNLKILIHKFIFAKKNLHFLSILGHFQVMKKNVKTGFEPLNSKLNSTIRFLVNLEVHATSPGIIAYNPLITCWSLNLFFSDFIAATL